MAGGFAPEGVSEGMKPKRIQLKRTKGWRTPKNCVRVCRPTIFGNPFKVGQDYGGGPLTRADAVEMFRVDPLCKPIWIAAEHTLRGKDLGCWCPLDQPCHADVLLEIANK